MQDIIIDIESPCKEKWDQMSSSKKGRHCASCNNTVIDFSKMADAEILKYFNEHDNFCGRFRNNQLQRPIQKSKPPYKRIINFPSKIAACIFTFLSLKNSAAFAQFSKPKQELIINSSTQKHSGKLEIKGFVKDDVEQLISGVDVFLNNVKVTRTDENGFYKIEIQDAVLRSHTIAFSKQQYRSTAVSFHPQMGNTTFDIKMCNYEGKECYSMGVPVIQQFSDVYFGQLVFKNFSLLKGRRLRTPLKKRLIEFAHTLRRNPMIKIQITSYYTKESEEKNCLIDAHQIVNFMVDEQGMDRSRFNIKVIKNKAKAKVLEFSDFREH